MEAAIAELRRAAGLVPPGAEVRLDSLSEQGREGRLFAVTIGADTTPRFALKLYDHDDASHAAARSAAFAGPPIGDAGTRAGAEYGALERVWTRAPSGIRRLIPEPVLHLESSPGFVVRWVVGKNAAPMVRRPGGARANTSLEAALHTSVDLLAWLDRETAVPAAAGVSAAEVVAAHRSLIRDAGVEAWVRERLDQALRMVGPATVELVLCHGEFAVRNLMVTPEGAAVALDWDTAFHGPRHFDVNMLMQNLRWWSIAPWVPRKRVEGLAARLRKAYLGTVRPDPGSFRAGGALALVHFLLLTAAWRRSPAGRLRGRAVKRYVDREIEELSRMESVI